LIRLSPGRPRGFLSAAAPAAEKKFRAHSPQTRRAFSPHLMKFGESAGLLFRRKIRAAGISPGALN
jgi:hypothetical protein